MLGILYEIYIATLLRGEEQDEDEDMMSEHEDSHASINFIGILTKSQIP